MRDDCRSEPGRAIEYPPLPGGFRWNRIQIHHWRVRKLEPAENVHGRIIRPDQGGGVPELGVSSEVLAQNFAVIGVPDSKPWVRLDPCF